MAITQIASFGDSLTQGTVDNVSTYQGGQGCWIEYATEFFAHRSDLGPIISPGFRQVHLISTADNEWVRNGTGWTQTTTQDLFDKAPFGRAFYSKVSTDMETWTWNSHWRPIVGFDIFWIDYSVESLIGGNWQYRIDGGSWVNMGQTLSHDNKLKKFYVNSSIASTLDFRPSDGVSAVGCLPVGITPYFVDPRTVSQGFIWHNLGSGAQQLGTNLVASGTVGDRLAWLDSVTLGTGSPINNNVSLVTNMFINDTKDNNTSAWNTNLTTLYNRVHNIGAKLLFMSPWEDNTAITSSLVQSQYRAQTKVTAAANNSKVFDIFDELKLLGISNYSDWVAQGYSSTDGYHESPLAMKTIGERLSSFIETNYFPISSKSNQITVASSTVANLDVLAGKPQFVTNGVGSILITDNAIN